MPVKTKNKVDVVVKNSPVHGKGLYAGEAIKKDTILGDLSGRWTSQDSMYTLWIDEERGFRVQCDFKYINHSGKPNVAYYDDLTVVALRNIKAGDELFHDYGWDDD
ncbi:SET domain protein lysine methyltransferase, putative [gamma proteobacterium HTCC5015]|nr:SET domain protein lysine methyltransferase, putative [gamma proteobacterium HTCC5015]